MQDEKKGEYEDLLASVKKDQELITNKHSLEVNLQTAKLKLQNAQLVEKSQRKDLLKKVKKDPRATENLQFLDTFALQQKITDAEVKLLVAENAQQIRRQLKLQEDCLACEYNKNLFTENKVKAFQKHLEDMLFKSVALAVRNTHLAEKEVKKIKLELHQAESAQKRIERLAEIRNQREKLANYKKRAEKKSYWEQKMAAVETLEKVAYW